MYPEVTRFQILSPSADYSSLGFHDTVTNLSHTPTHG